MLSPGVVMLFRLVHILAGVFWVGAVLFFARFLYPAARTLGPAAGPVMDHLTRVGRLSQTLLTAAILTVLSGLGLYWHDSAGFKGEWVRSHTAMVFGTGALLGIIAVVIGAAVNSPAAKRMGELSGQIQAQKSPPTSEQAAEMQRLQGRLGAALRVVAVLLVLATAAMALARYVP